MPPFYTHSLEPRIRRDNRPKPMTSARPSSAPSRQQQQQGLNVPIAGLGKTVVPKEWVHDRFARALVESYRLKNPNATKEQVEAAVVQVMSNPKSGGFAPPAPEVAMMVKKVIKKRTHANKKLSDLAQKRMAEGKKSPVKVALDVLKEAIKRRAEHEIKTGTGPGETKMAPAPAPAGGPQRPRSAPHPPKQQQQHQHAGAGMAMGKVQMSKRKGDAHHKGQAQQQQAPAAHAHAQAGGKKDGGKKDNNHKKGKQHEQQPKAKENKAELAKKAKEAKEKKEAMQAMQREAARLLRKPKLSFAERISLPNCDAEFIKSLEGGKGKKGKAGKKKAKISLLPRLVDLLYYGGLRPEGRLENPVKLSDIHCMSLNEIIVEDKEDGLGRMGYVYMFLTNMFSLLITLGRYESSRVEKIAIRELIKKAAALNPKVYEATQKIILSKTLGKYQKDTLDVEKDPSMPKVSVEGKVADMHTETLNGIDNEHYNAWVERNTYDFGFSHWLLKEHYMKDSGKVKVDTIMKISQLGEIGQWKEWNNLDLKSKEIKALLVHNMFTREMRITLLNRMFGVVYNMLADVLVVMHAPFHQVMLHNLVNLYLRMWNGNGKSAMEGTPFDKDLRVFWSAVNKLVKICKENSEKILSIGEEAAADEIVRGILSHKFGKSDFVDMLVDRDLQDRKLAPERARAYEKFLDSLMDHRLKQIEMKPFEHIEEMLKRHRNEGWEKLPVDFKNVTMRMFRLDSKVHIDRELSEQLVQKGRAPPRWSVIEHKHDYDAIVHRLGTLGGWIRSVGVDKAAAVLGVPFLNEQGFVRWPLVDAGSELEGGASKDGAGFMKARNARLMPLYGLMVGKGGDFDDNALSVEYPSRVAHVMFDIFTFVEEFNRFADVIEQKISRRENVAKVERSEAYLTLMEARKARQIAKAEERKKAKEENKRKKESAKEHKAAVGGEKKKENKEKKEKKEKKKKEKKAKTPRIQEIEAIEKAIIQEERREEAAEVAGSRIEELSSSEDEGVAVPEIASTSIAPIPEEGTVEGDETETAAPLSRSEVTADGKDMAQLESPRDVTNVAF